MAWISQNWGYILLVIGVLYLMNRGGMGCGHGGGGAHHRGGGHDEDDIRLESEANIDPVNGQAVDPQTAVSTVYQGRAYYFSSRENRNRFEAAPEHYAAKPQGRQGKRHGCC